MIVSGCKKPIPVEGEYKYYSSEVTEDLELMIGGEFRQQVLVNGHKYSAAGHWSLNGRKVMLDGGYLVRFDTQLRKNIDPPVEYSSYWGYLEDHNSRISLGIDDVAGLYYLDRTGQNK